MKEPIIFCSLFFFFLLSIILIIKISILHAEGKIVRSSVFNKIDKIVFFFSIIAIFLSFLFDVNYLQYKSPILYKDWKSITLDDFKGIKLPFQTLYGSYGYAYIVSDIIYVETEEYIEVQSRFHPSRSYVFDSNVKFKRLLTHELYHFHITEYCARKFRESISNDLSSGRKSELVKLYLDCYSLRDNLNDEYDKQTNHGLLLGKQKEWQHNVDSLLKSKEKFVESRIKI